MKAISIQQPYAHLVAIGEKRVENRVRWKYSYFGPILIHASKGRDYLLEEDLSTFPSMAFGSIVGAVELIAVRSSLQLLMAGTKSAIYHGRRFVLDWVIDHKHTEGPMCLIFHDNAVMFPRPIPFRGQLGVFNVPDNLPGLAEQLAAFHPIGGVT